MLPPSPWVCKLMPIPLLQMQLEHQMELLTAGAEPTARPTSINLLIDRVKDHGDVRLAETARAALNVYKAVKRGPPQNVTLKSAVQRSQGPKLLNVAMLAQASKADLGEDEETTDSGPAPIFRRFTEENALQLTTPTDRPERSKPKGGFKGIIKKRTDPMGIQMQSPDWASGAGSSTSEPIKTLREQFEEEVTPKKPVDPERFKRSLHMSRCVGGDQGRRGSNGRRGSGALLL